MTADAIATALDRLTRENRAANEATAERLDRLEAAIVELSQSFRAHETHNIAQHDRAGKRMTQIENATSALGKHLPKIPSLQPVEAGG